MSLFFSPTKIDPFSSQSTKINIKCLFTLILAWFLGEEMWKNYPRNLPEARSMIQFESEASEVAMKTSLLVGNNKKPEEIS
jgi:hypothetical protein